MVDENRYGHIEGLDDEELADPWELEQMVYKQDWGPILALPVQTRRCMAGPNVDEDGRADWGAFGSVDFERYRGRISKRLQKAEALNEQRKDTVIRLQMVNERMTDKRRFEILKWLRTGVIGLVDIVDEDMYQMGRLYLRLLKLEKEIGRLRAGGGLWSELD